MFHRNAIETFSPDTVAVEVTKELNSKQAIEDPEEDKEQGNIVDLLAWPLKDLVESGLGHGELEAGPDVSDHDKGAGGSGQAEGGVLIVPELEGVHHYRAGHQSQHGEVKLAPAGPGMISG